jgi:hypothetical protein
MGEAMIDSVPLTITRVRKLKATGAILRDVEVGVLGAELDKEEVKTAELMKSRTSAALKGGGVEEGDPP